MRYLLKAKVKSGKAAALKQAIESRTLGQGSIAGSEYIRDMNHARQLEDGSVVWVEVCYCPTPLEEELPYWEEYFDILKIKDAHDRRKCKDWNGIEPWSCGDCDCTERLEERITEWGPLFLRR